jgi:hypothetical protein
LLGYWLAQTVLLNIRNIYIAYRILFSILCF